MPNYQAGEIKQVVLIILAQIGGEQFLSMVKPLKLLAKPGPFNLGTLEIVIDARLTKGNGTHYSISLNAMDEYDIEYFRLESNGKKIVLSSHQGVYCDMLQDLFRADTALSPVFPTIRAVQ